jgi:hypothetical protein
MLLLVTIKWKMNSSPKCSNACELHCLFVKEKLAKISSPCTKPWNREMTASSSLIVSNSFSSLVRILGN